MTKKFRVVGVAFVPVEVEMVVEAETEAEAEAKALRLEATNPYETMNLRRELRLGDFIVSNSADESAAFDFAVNQIIPILE
jgi:hypothetical protein